MMMDYAVYMLDPEGVVVGWNRGARDLKGYEASEVLGQHFSIFYTQAERDAGAPARALLDASTDGRFEHEGWRVRKDGSQFWARAIIDPIHDKDGVLVGFAKMTRDLTEVRRTQQEHARSEAQFRRLVQGVTDYAIYMLDPTGHIASWNAGAERIKGYTADEILGAHFSRFYTPEDRALNLPEVGLETAAREGRFEREGWRVRKDGSRFLAHVIIDAIRDEETGELLGFAKVTRDITERHHTQQALERTRQALFQTQKLESIGQLTGGIAHDFNNLLTAIIGCLELIAKRLPETDIRTHELLQNALDGAQRGSILTQRMLAFARRQELTFEAVDVVQLVQGMRELLGRSIGPHIRIQTSLPDSLPPVRGDANQLEAALLNLVVNARDAMPHGGLIRIRADEAPAEAIQSSGLPKQRYLRLSVADEGTGMDADTLARATEPFFTTKGVGKGTGLGLSMVHGLTEQLAGKLRLDSSPGDGTTVELFLPLADTASPSVPRTRGEQAEPRGRADITVLIVDDDALVLLSTAAVVEDLGYTVRRADSAAQALEILAEDASIQVVLTDQAMPGMTGLELAAVLREAYPHLPVVLATGYADLGNAELGAIRRLSKPFRRIELAETLAGATKSR